MKPGDVVDARFEVQRLAGKGGMGSVYLARDVRSGAEVALKVMGGPAQAADRFAQEIGVLRGLSHPGIVGYLGHGWTGDGLPYLAMEWLDGEDLSARLERGALTRGASLAVARGVASALAVAHAQGIVHRDIKPSNLFLVGGSVDRVKVLDFGVARLRGAGGPKTETGMMVGTPGYLAPEQARGSKDVDARADVFSLGCVLHECLTGTAPFAAEQVMAVLAKILLEEAPRLAALVKGTPPALDALVARMLAKEPAERPHDGAALLAELDAQSLLDGDEAGAVASGRVGPTRIAALTQREMTLLSVVLVGRPPEAIEDEVTAPTVSATAPELPGLARIEARIAAFGGRIEPLADGSHVVMLSGTRTATDQVAQAARCALAIRALEPHAPMALSTGRAMVADRWPVGEVIDRAAFLLRLPLQSVGSAERRRPLRIDQMTAGLLDVRFEVGGDGAGLVLRGEREILDAGRTLLGRTTPCVGREWELSSLDALYRRTVEEPTATAVVVTGAAGVGKSRLRYELLRRVRERGEAVEIWLGRGDPVSRGAPFGMVAPALRQSAGILDGEPLAVRRRKVEARVARHIDGASRRRVSEFLGELLGVPFPDEESVQLRAARADPALMGDQIKRAWEDFVAAETTASTVVIVLEDLHVGDLPSVKLIDAALRVLADRPLLVLALGRPEVNELFPHLWSERGVEQLHLGPLKRKGGEALIRAVLGDDVSPDVMARVWERSAGNAFYLEELIRAVAEGRGDDLPPTVLAMVQARLEGLPAGARRVLRAASVFGPVFWRSAVTSLLGGSETLGEVDPWLADLAERELIAPQGEGRFPGEREYAFRQATVREAAYAMLTDGDRRLGHLLAGGWLEAAGEPFAATLAVHFEQGGDLGKAITWYRRAAEQAMEANDLAAALDRSERAVRCGAAGEELGALRAIQAEAQAWSGDNVAAERAAALAMEALPRGSERWYAAAAEAIVARAKLGNVQGAAALAEDLRALLAQGKTARAGLVTAARTTIPLFLLGQHALGDAILAALEGQAGLRAASDPALRARILYARAIRAAVHGNPGGLLSPMAAAAASYEESGDLRNASMQRVNVGFGFMELGAYAEAEHALREALGTAERLGLTTVAATAKHDLGLVLGRRGAREEAIAVEGEAIAAFQAQKDRRMEGASRNYLALLWLAASDPAAAEREALAALELLAGSSPMRVYTLGTLAEARLRMGHGDTALACSEEGMTLLATLGGIDEGESYLRLVHAEALHAAGRFTEARAAIAVARDKLLLRGSRINDPARRATFLEQVPENARTLRLATVLDQAADRAPG